MSQQYYIRSRGTVRGPFPPEKLKELARRGQFSRVHHVSVDGVNWEPAANHPELLPEAKVLKVRKPHAVPEEEDSGYDLAEPESPVVASGGHRETPRQESAQENTSWYYAHAGREYGPVSFAELAQLASRGELQYNDCVWMENMSDWTEAWNVPGLFDGDYANLNAPAAGGYSSAMDAAAGGGRAASMAMASLILGILGVTVCFGLAGIPAIICGHLALRQIAVSGDTGERKLAKAGLILGYVGLGLGALSLLGGLFAVVLSMAMGSPA